MSVCDWDDSGSDTLETHWCSVNIKQNEISNFCDRNRLVFRSRDWHHMTLCIAWSRLSTSVTSHDTFYCLITIKYWCDITWYAERVSLRQCHTNESGKLCNCGSTSMTLSLRDKVLETKIDQKYNIYHSRNHSTLVILKQNNHMYVMYNWIENFWFLR